MRPRLVGRRLLLPGSVLVLSLGVVLAAAARFAARVEPPAPAPASVVAADLPEPARPVSAVPDGPSEAVAADPFRPDRRPAPTPFRMPGEALASERADDQPPSQPIVLIGTAVLPDDRGFAMCQVGGEPPRLIRIGESMSGYTLRAVAQGRATFRTRTGQQLDVRVARTGS